MFFCCCCCFVCDVLVSSQQLSTLIHTNFEFSPVDLHVFCFFCSHSIENELLVREIHNTNYSYIQYLCAYAILHRTNFGQFVCEGEQVKWIDFDSLSHTYTHAMTTRYRCLTFMCSEYSFSLLQRCWNWEFERIGNVFQIKWFQILHSICIDNVLYFSLTSD